MLCSHSDIGYYVAFRVTVWTESEQERLRLCSHSDIEYYVAFRVIVWTESERERLRLCSHSDTGYYVAFRVIVWTEFEQERLRLCSHSGTGSYVAFRVIVRTESEQDCLRLCSHSDIGYYVAFRVVVWTESEQQRPGTGASRLHTSKASIWVVKFCRLQIDAKTEPSCKAQLKELCHEIYQNLKGGNCDQIKCNMKRTAYILKSSLFVELGLDTFLRQMDGEQGWNMGIWLELHHTVT